MNKLNQLKQNLISNNTLFPIYLDNQATTQVDPRVLHTMLPYFTKVFGNPHSKSHSYAWEAQEACEKAREKVANVINASPKEIIFTSGATESNNIAIKGIAKFHKKENKNHIITLATEHKCILNTCRYLEQEGFEVTYLPVMQNGLIDLNILQSSITSSTILVSIMAVNNEIGVIQPLEEIGNICKKKEVYFHSDIAQAFGKINIDVDKYNIDLASISGHKIHGPKGIGALYIRKKPRVRLAPFIHGGGQERGVRSGTLSTPLVVGLGAASEIAYNEMDSSYKHIKTLFDFFVSTIQSHAEDIYLNGDKNHRYHGNVNLSFAYIEGESMILAIKDLAVSSGSACTSSSLEPSYILHALGVTDDLAHTSLRIGFSKFTTIAEVEYAAYLILSRIKKLRNLSPLWEMKQEGIDINSIQWSMH